MTFLNLTMLAALVALAIPVLIHLFNRSRAKLMDWGAMRFLRASFAHRSRRILLEELLLLMLRCSLVALVVLAMARPFVPLRSTVPWPTVLPAALAAVVCVGAATVWWSSRRARVLLLTLALLLIVLAGASAGVERWLQERTWALGRSGRDVAVVIDASTSMTLARSGKSSFERAVEEARRVVASCRTADAVSLILAGAVPRSVVPRPVFDHAHVQSALDEAAVIGGTMRVPEALSAARASLAEGHNPTKAVVLITDGQATGWHTVSRARWEFIAEGFRGLPTPPRVICRRLPLPSPFRNAAASGMSTSRRIVGLDRPVTIDIKVTNTGSVPIRPSMVELEVDGVLAARKNIEADIPSGAAETFYVSHRFTRPGRAVLAARVVGQDDLPADDRCVHVLNVIDRLPVLIVEGVQTAGPLGGAATFMDIALTPRDRRASPTDPEDDPIRDVVEPVVVAAPDVDKVHDLQRFALVILANVPQLPGVFAARMVEYVQRGGGVLIVAGDRARPQFYNTWNTAAAGFVAPARLVRYVSAPDELRRLDPKSFRHQAVALLEDAHQSDVASAVLSSYWSLSVDAQDPDVRVGARLDTGEPLLVERRSGKGCILLMAAPLDPTGGNLPALKCFVPLVHELAYYLAEPSMQHGNLRPGAEFTTQLRAQPSPGPPEGSGLLGEYFDDKELRSRIATRVDPVVDFSWGRDRPHPAVGDDDFSVQWTGWVQPAYSEAYTFYAVADDGVRLSVDGRSVIEQWSDHYPTEHAGAIELQSGHRYRLRMRYYENSGEALVQLLWSSPSQAKEIVPAQRLYPSWSPGVGEGERIASADSPTAPPGPGVLALTPSGRRVAATAAAADNDVVVTFADTDEPGLYRIQLPPELQRVYFPGMPASQGIPFTVVSDPAESVLQELTDDDIAMVSSHIDLVMVDTGDHLLSALTGNAPGQEFWEYLAAAAIVVLMLETAVTRWIAAQRKWHRPRPVAFDVGSPRSPSFPAAADRARGTSGLHSEWPLNT